MLSLTCDVAARQPFDFYVLNDNCSHMGSSKAGETAATTVLFAILSAVAFILLIVTLVRYNSVTILKYSIHVNAISNTWWIFHFFWVGVRAILAAIQYSYRFHKEAFFLSSWFFGAVELLFFCLALNYQRKYRSSDHVASEIGSYDLTGKARIRSMELRDGVYRAFVSSGLLIFVAFIIVIVSICLLQFLSAHLRLYFWMYVASLLLLHLCALTLAALIARAAADDGPFKMTKVFFVLAVVFSTPADLPVFIWKHCAHMSCWGGVMTMYDLFLMMKIASVVMMFCALILEYRRLKRECQWAMLNEIKGFSF